MTTPPLHPNFHAVAAEARELRERLERAKGLCADVEPAATFTPIRVEALKLLTECGAPAPLVMLLAELMEAERALLNPDVSEAKLIAAKLEAARPLHPKGERPSDMNDVELHEAVEAELKKRGSKTVTRVCVRKWRLQPAYWALVFMHRQERDGLFTVPASEEEQQRWRADIERLKV